MTCLAVPYEQDSLQNEKNELISAGQKVIKLLTMLCDGGHSARVTIGLALGVPSREHSATTCFFFKKDKYKNDLNGLEAKESNQAQILLWERQIIALT